MIKRSMARIQTRITCQSRRFRTVMVARDLRVTLEKPLADPEDVEPAEKNDRQEKAEDDSKREHRVAVFMDNGEDGAAIHIRQIADALRHGRMEGASVALEIAAAPFQLLPNHAEERDPWQGCERQDAA